MAHPSLVKSKTNAKPEKDLQPRTDENTLRAMGPLPYTFEVYSSAPNYTGVDQAQLLCGSLRSVVHRLVAKRRRRH